MSTENADRFLSAVASGSCSVDCAAEPTCPLYGLQPLVFDPNHDAGRCEPGAQKPYVCPKTELNNYCQRRKIKLTYCSDKEDGYFVSTVYVGTEAFESGGFRNRRSSEMDAAERALIHLSEQAPFLQRDGHSIEPIFSSQPTAVQADIRQGPEPTDVDSDCDSIDSDWCEVVERSEEGHTPCCPEVTLPELTEANALLRNQNLGLRDRLKVELAEESRATRFEAQPPGPDRVHDANDRPAAQLRRQEAENVILHLENTTLRQRLDGIEPTVPQSDDYIPYAGYTHFELCTENALLRKQLHEKAVRENASSSESTFVRLLNSLSETKAGQSRVEEKIHHAKVEADDNIAIITQKIDSLARLKIGNIRTKLNQLKLQFNKAKADLKAALDSGERSSSKCMEWRDRFNELKADRDSLRSDNDHLQMENGAITLQLGRLTEELDEQKTQAAKLEAASAKLTQERDFLGLELNDCRADCDFHKYTLDEKQRELDAACANLSETKAENTTLNEERSFVDSCVRDQSAQIKRLKAQAKESPENVQQFTMLLDVIRDGDRERDALKAEIAAFTEQQRKDADTIAALRLQNKIYHDDYMSERRDRQRAQDVTKFDRAAPKSASNELQKFIFGADTVVDGPYSYLQCPKCKAIFEQTDLQKFDEHVARCF